MPAMRAGACARWWLGGEDGDSRAVSVGSASLKVARGSRQAPPWMKLGG